MRVAEAFKFPPGGNLTGASIRRRSVREIQIGTRFQFGRPCYRCGDPPQLIRNCVPNFDNVAIDAKSVSRRRLGKLPISWQFRRAGPLSNRNQIRNSCGFGRANPCPAGIPLGMRAGLDPSRKKSVVATLPFRRLSIRASAFVRSSPVLSMAVCRDHGSDLFRLFCPNARI